MSYKHLGITEREKIAIYPEQGLTLYAIAKLLDRNKLTISRELNCNSGEYLPSKAPGELFKVVKRLFLGLHWSPEQIANRGKPPIGHELNERFNQPMSALEKTIGKLIP